MSQPKPPDQTEPGNDAPTAEAVRPDDAVKSDNADPAPVRPAKAELAAAKRAAAEPVVAGLVPSDLPGPPRTRPAVPESAAAPPDTSTRAPRSTTSRVATGVVAALAIVATVFAVSASESTNALANSTITPQTSAAPSGPVDTSPTGPFISVGTGTTSGVLVLTGGQVLYYNDQDAPPPISIPACVGDCAQVWLPLAPSDKVPLTVGPGIVGSIYTIVRPDGSTQVTFNGHPLYVFTVDAPGHMTGAGLTDVFAGQAFSWHAASATATPVVPSPSASPAPDPLLATTPPPPSPTA